MPYGVCGQISADILFDCDNPMIAGAKDRLILINFDDWDGGTITKNISNPQIIEAITLASGGAGYIFEGKNYSTEPRAALMKERYSEAYEHEVIFKVFKNDAATKQQLEKAVKGRVVAIIENNHKGSSGNSAFEVYGADSGLDVQELERITSDTDTQGAYNVVLKSSEMGREPHLPATLFITSYAATKAVVDGLL